MSTWSIASTALYIGWSVSIDKLDVFDGATVGVGFDKSADELLTISVVP